MQFDWNQFIDHTLNITMLENYGVVHGDKKSDHPTFYEIVFKTGKMIGAYDEGILLESVREGRMFKIFVPYSSIKCVEIF